MKIVKSLLATLGAAVLLGSLVSSASARSLSVDNQSLRFTFSSLRFHLPESTVDCPIILEGSLHRRTIPKVSGSLIGYITRAELGICPFGTATILRETLPWHVRYHGFEGVLPNIGSIISHIINASFRIRSSAGVTCLVRSTAAEPAVGRFHRDVSNHLTVGIEGSIRTDPGCFGFAVSFRSDSPQVVLLGTLTAISLTLI